MYICKKIPKLLFPTILLLISLPLLLPQINNPAVPASVNAETADLPVIMYHSLADNPSRAGDYVLLPLCFEMDMKYLHEKGFNSVSAEQVYDFAKKGTPLPADPIMITLDDGFLNNLTDGLPVLEKYDMCAVVNVVGSYSLLAEEYDDHNPLYAYLTPDEILDLKNSGRIEIGCHTFDMHSLSPRKGCSRKNGESSAQYETALSDDCSLFNDFLLEHCNMQTRIFAYPYGLISENSSRILYENGFDILFTCYERVNHIPQGGLSDNVLFLDRYNRPSGMSSEEYFSKIFQ